MDFLQILSEVFLVLTRIHPDIIKKYIGLPVQYRCSWQIKMKLDFLTDFRKNSQTSNFMRIRSVGAELLHDDRRTDDRLDEANCRFSQFCEKRLTQVSKIRGLEL